MVAPICLICRQPIAFDSASRKNYRVHETCYEEEAVAPAFRIKKRWLGDFVIQKRVPGTLDYHDVTVLMPDDVTEVASQSLFCGPYRRFILKFSLTGKLLVKTSLGKDLSTHDISICLSSPIFQRKTNPNQL